MYSTINWSYDYSWLTTNTSFVGIFSITQTGYLSDNSFYENSTSFTLTVLDTCVTLVIPMLANQMYTPYSATSNITNYTIPAFTLASPDPGCLHTTFTYTYTCLPPTGGDCSGIVFDPSTLYFDWSTAPFPILGDYALSV
jgi:hypothetical protein